MRSSFKRQREGKTLAGRKRQKLSDDQTKFCRIVMLGRTTESSKEYALHAQGELYEEEIRAGINFLVDPQQFPAEQDTCRAEGFHFLLIADQENIRQGNFGIKSFVPGVRSKTSITLEDAISIMVEHKDEGHEDTFDNDQFAISSAQENDKLRKQRDMLRNTNGDQPQGNNNQSIYFDEDDGPIDPRARGAIDPRAQGAIDPRARGAKIDLTHDTDVSDPRRRAPPKEPRAAAANEYDVDSIPLEDTPKEENKKEAGNTLESLLSFFMENPDSIDQDKEEVPVDGVATTDEMQENMDEFPMDTNPMRANMIRNGMTNQGMQNRDMRNQGMQNQGMPMGNGPGLQNQRMDRAAPAPVLPVMNPMGGGRQNNLSGLGVCFEWMRGMCSRGPACKFRHEAPARGPNGGGPEYCRNWQRGKCLFKDCKYLHENPPMPQPNLGVARPMIPQEYCRNWQRGKCFFKDCKYLHENPPGGAPVRMPPPRGPPLGPPRGPPRGPPLGPPRGPPREVCRDWMKGRCVMKVCKYLHERPRNGMVAPPGRPGPFVGAKKPPVAQVCRDWLRGKCSRDLCRFRHENPGRGRVMK